MGGASDASVTEPASSSSRNRSATASAEAEKATTIAGDQQRLRNRVAAHAGGLPPARDDAAQQEHTVADQIEREDLSQRLRVDDESVEPEADERGSGEPEQRGRAHDRHRAGAPASSNVSVSASEGISATSITMMSGLAKPSG